MPQSLSEQVARARSFQTVPVVEGLWDRGNLGALCRLCDGAIHTLIFSLILAERVHSWGAYSFAVSGLGIGALHSINTQCGPMPSVLFRAGEQSMVFLHTSANISICKLEN